MHNHPLHPPPKVDSTFNLLCAQQMFIIDSSSSDISGSINWFARSPTHPIPDIIHTQESRRSMRLLLNNKLAKKKEKTLATAL